MKTDNVYSILYNIIKILIIQIYRIFDKRISLSNISQQIDPNFPRHPQVLMNSRNQFSKFHAIIAIIFHNPREFPIIFFPRFKGNKIAAIDLHRRNFYKHIINRRKKSMQRWDYPRK